MLCKLGINKAVMWLDVVGTTDQSVTTMGVLRDTKRVQKSVRGMDLDKGVQRGYHWLPLAAIDLVGDNREFKAWAIFLMVIPITAGWESQNFKGASLFCPRLPLVSPSNL